MIIVLPIQVSTQLADLSGENEKLRKHNQMLSSELAQTKKQCDELIAFLRKVAPDQITGIMNATAASDAACGGSSDCDDDENEKCMKLFGVTVKKKRSCGESSDLRGSRNKEIKRTLVEDFCNKVCN